MEIIRARAMGMCRGVRRAIQYALAQPRPQEITIFGELAHNEEVNRRLSERGFRALPEAGRAAMPETPAVLVTAHGISRREWRRLEAAGKQLIDTTCPLVARIHDAAQRFQEAGRFVVVIGKALHVEVRGIVGDLRRFAVVASEDDVRRYPARRLGVVCQSTVSPALAERVLAAIRARNAGADVAFANTICQATRDRRQAVLDLLERIEGLVIVGGRRSNNTLELVELARAAGTPCLHVQTAGELRSEWFRGRRVVGLTAGASTPDETIEAVHRRLRRIDAAPRHAEQRKRPAAPLHAVAG